MKNKSNFLSLTLLVAISAAVIMVSCSKDDPLTELDETNAAVTKYIPANFGVYKITQAGTYIIEGTVKGEYIEISTGNVTIKGQGSNPTFQGKVYSTSQARSKSHIRGGGNGFLTIKDFTFQGKVHHNFMSVNSDNTLIENLKVYNSTKDGAGAINPGANSMVRDCYIEPHDDAIKITEPDSKAEDNECKMDGNGAVIQLGWGLRADGAIHHAKRIKIRGYLKNNGQTNTNSNPGRAIIGGIFENPVSDIKITNLDIDLTSEHNGHYVKLVADGVTAQDIEITGVIKNTVSVVSGIKPVALATKNGGKIKNITIDFGNKIKSADIYQGTGVSGLTIGGGSSDPCDNDPKPTGSILVSNLNAAGDGRVKVSASDNSQVTRVEVFEGSQSRGFLTAPNAGADYRIISSALDDGDNYTVVITDDCNNTKTLSGTINGGGSGDPCASDPAPTGSIVKTDYNGAGDGRIIVSAADNGTVVSVEVFKGSTSMGVLTAPNVAPNYRFVNSALNPGNNFTVVITDDCGKTTTLNGTMP